MNECLVEEAKMVLQFGVHPSLDIHLPHIFKQPVALVHPTLDIHLPHIFKQSRPMTLQFSTKPQHTNATNNNERLQHNLEPSCPARLMIKILKLDGVPEDPIDLYKIIEIVFVPWFSLSKLTGIEGIRILDKVHVMYFLMPITKHILYHALAH
ncbi:hypothetical protein ACJX0J_028441 [Zea mays]